MKKKNIINIDESKCIGCGECAKGCGRNVIEIIGGKAKVVGDNFCEGIGKCIAKCPRGAITILCKPGV